MDKLSLLESVPIFSDLSKSDLTKISDRMTQRTFTKNQMILLEDDLGQTFFVISKGSVKITRLSDDGREVILAMFDLNHPPIKSFDF